jgi:ubiquinone/menaquinone biosynthesis C-methylase UbiE
MHTPESNNTQQAFYENEWSNITLNDAPGKSGWRTVVPAPDFVDFVTYLRENNVSGKALDIGCGGGRHSILLAQNGFKVSGLDFADSAIKQAKENAEKAGVASSIDFRAGDALDLPYNAAYFNLVNDDGCLHHIDPRQWDTYVRGIVRVLKAGGIFRVKAFSKNYAYYVKNSTAESSSQWLPLVDSGYTYFFNETDIRKLFANGFKEIRLEENFHTQTQDKKFFFGVFRKL